MSVEDRLAGLRSHGAAGALGEITAAVALLTRIPVGRPNGTATGAAAFGLVGAFVGVLGAVVMVAIGGAVPMLAAVLAVGAMALVSGGLHLDGLADTADALVAPDAARAEAARKDPAIGAGGTVTLILVLATQVAALASLAAEAGAVVAGLVCVAAGAVSRTLPVIAARLGSGATSRAGLGAWFAERVSGLDAAIAVLTAAVVAIVAGVLSSSPAVLIGVAIGSGLGLALTAWLLRARRQLDGDLLGASVELGLAAILGAAAVAVTVAWPIP